MAECAKTKNESGNLQNEDDDVSQGLQHIYSTLARARQAGDDEYCLKRSDNSDNDEKGGNDPSTLGDNVGNCPTLRPRTDLERRISALSVGGRPPPAQPRPTRRQHIEALRQQGLGRWQRNKDNVAAGTASSQGTDTEDEPPDARSTRRKAKNVLTRMKAVTGPLSLLYRSVNERLKVKVWTRSANSIRGICTGYILAFDTHFNMVMADVDEVYKPGGKPDRSRPKKARKGKNLKAVTNPASDTEIMMDVSPMASPISSPLLQVDGAADSSTESDSDSATTACSTASDNENTTTAVPESTTDQQHTSSTVESSSSEEESDDSSNNGENLEELESKLNQLKAMYSTLKTGKTPEKQEPSDEIPEMEVSTVGENQDTIDPTQEAKSPVSAKVEDVYLQKTEYTEKQGETTTDLTESVAQSPGRRRSERLRRKSETLDTEYTPSTAVLDQSCDVDIIKNVVSEESTRKDRTPEPSKKLKKYRFDKKMNTTSALVESTATKPIHRTPPTPTSPMIVSESPMKSPGRNDPKKTARLESMIANLKVDSGEEEKKAQDAPTDLRTKLRLMREAKDKHNKAGPKEEDIESPKHIERRTGRQNKTDYSDDSTDEVPVRRQNRREQKNADPKEGDRESTQHFESRSVRRRAEKKELYSDDSTDEAAGRRKHRQEPRDAVPDRKQKAEEKNKDRKERRHQDRHREPETHRSSERLKHREDDSEHRHKKQDEREESRRRKERHKDGEREKELKREEHQKHKDDEREKGRKREERHRHTDNKREKEHKKEEHQKHKDDEREKESKREGHHRHTDNEREKEHKKEEHQKHKDDEREKESKREECQRHTDDEREREHRRGRSSDRERKSYREKDQELERHRPKGSERPKSQGEEERNRSNDVRRGAERDRPQCPVDTRDKHKENLQLRKHNLRDTRLREVESHKDAPKKAQTQRALSGTNYKPGAKESLPMEPTILQKIKGTPIGDAGLYQRHVNQMMIRGDNVVMVSIVP